MQQLMRGDRKQHDCHDEEPRDAGRRGSRGLDRTGVEERPDDCWSDEEEERCRTEEPGKIPGGAARRPSDQGPVRKVKCRGGHFRDLAKSVAHRGLPGNPASIAQRQNRRQTNGLPRGRFPAGAAAADGRKGRRTYFRGARCQRSGFVGSRAITPFASRSSWTHFAHQAALAPAGNKAGGR